MTKYIKLIEVSNALAELIYHATRATDAIEGEAARPEHAAYRTMCAVELRAAIKRANYVAARAPATKYKIVRFDRDGLRVIYADADDASEHLLRMAP